MKIKNTSSVSVKCDNSTMVLQKHECLFLDVCNEVFRAAMS